MSFRGRIVVMKCGTGILPVQTKEPFFISPPSQAQLDSGRGENSSLHRMTAEASLRVVEVKRSTGILPVQTEGRWHEL